jgi:hypothetical protein
MSPFRRASGRGGAGHGVAACALAVLYLVLSSNALACALHHGLHGSCPHTGGAHGAMAGMHGVPAAPPDPLAPPASRGVGLCHCLDNLAAEPPAALLAAAPVPLPPGIVPVPTALPAAPPAGPARPRAPPRSETA